MFKGMLRHGLRRERRRSSPATHFCGLLLITGCTNPAPAPISPSTMLSDLRELRADSALGDLGRQLQDASVGISIDDAVAIALRHNPGLRAARSRVGIAQADVVIAGLFPDPQLSADLSDLGVLKSKLDSGGDVDSIDLSSDPIDWVAGIDLSFPLPRPGEIDARTDAATARLAATRSDIARAEWQLVRDVRSAFIRQLVAAERLEWLQRSVQIAARTGDFFERSRELGATTALEANLASLELTAIEERREGLRVAQRIASQSLNQRIGLPPEPALTLRQDASLFDTSPPDGDVNALVDRAIDQRPDLSILRSRYEEAEADLRLEISRRWPGLSIGTSLSIDLPIFSKMNEPAIQAALARRDQLRDEVRAEVHRIRGEVHYSIAEWERWQRQADYFEAHTAPQLQRSLQLVDESFAARELTLLDALTAQRQALDAQERRIELRLGAAIAATHVLTAIADGMPSYIPTPRHELQDENEATP